MDASTIPSIIAAIVPGTLIALICICIALVAPSPQVQAPISDQHADLDEARTAAQVEAKTWTDRIFDWVEGYVAPVLFAIITLAGLAMNFAYLKTSARALVGL